MKSCVPRFLLAGTGSGCGKTTVTCAVLRALVDRGLSVGAFKCGPDYIDTMFHSKITGTQSTNLDLFFFDENTAKYLLARNGSGCAVSVIEGVMGYYDGMGLKETTASTYEVAKMTETPAVLVINAKGTSLSVLAAIHGFVTFYPDSQIQGVILNQCSAMSYPALAQAILERFEGRVRPLGYLPRMEDCTLESRRLGLVTAEQVERLEEKLKKLAKQAECTIDLDGLLALAAKALPVDYVPIEWPRYPSVRIAVAKDAAFCFYYGDHLQALQDMGAQLVPFSPLSDGELPQNIQGLYLGGGYPELYARELSENKRLRRSIHDALQRGLPCIAECGGFMYLTERIGGYEMVGFLPGACFDTGKLVRFGYAAFKAKADNLLCKAGEEIRGHEFHYWDATEPGNDFSAAKPSGKRWDCAFATSRLYAGYPHFHFYANPSFAKSFYKACLQEGKLYD